MTAMEAPQTQEAVTYRRSTTPTGRKDLKTVYVTGPLHRKLAILAASDQRPLRDLVEQVLGDYAESHPIQVGESVGA